MQLAVTGRNEGSGMSRSRARRRQGQGEHYGSENGDVFVLDHVVT